MIKLLSIDKQANIILSDVTGQTIPVNIKLLSDGNIELNFENQPRGIYFLQIKNNNKIALFKLIRK
jgi:small nuclear ribonucleoprotein (snRNP)-like protein